MKCVVLNDSKRLSRLGSKVVFETIPDADEDAYREGLLRLMRRQTEPFVLLWHEQPAIGLRLLSDLEEKAVLPANWRGGVFFRAVAYAGLVREQDARDFFKKSLFPDQLHIFADRVSEIAPNRIIISRFSRFVDAVNSMTGTEVALPFKLLDPPRQQAGLLTLWLAGRLIQERRLSDQEVIASLNWQPIIREGQQAGYSFGLRPGDPDDLPGQAVRHISKYSHLMRQEAKWRCDLCDQRHRISHAELNRKVLDQATPMKNSRILASDPADVKKLCQYVAEAVAAINQQQYWLTAEGGMIQAAAAGQIEPYLNGKSPRVLDELSTHVRELFQTTCLFYLNRNEIQQQAKRLSQATASITAHSATEGGEIDLHLGDIIAAAEKIIALLRCPTTQNGNEVRLYEITKNPNC